MKKIILIIIAILIFGGFFIFVKPQREISIQNNNKNSLSQKSSQKSSGFLGDIKEIFTSALGNNNGGDNKEKNIFSPNKNSVVNSLVKPEAGPKEAIRDYLISSSNIGFFKDASRLTLAVDLAALGDKQEIENIIAEIKAKYVIFQALQPPEEAADIHQQSLKVIGMFIGLLEKVKSSQREEMGKILGSPEASQIEGLINDTKQKINDLVKKYNIELPPGVMQ